MPRFTPARVAVLAAAAGLLGVAVIAATATASASSVNRRPVCNDIGFNLPAPIGSQVQIPVTDVAADPDLTPVELVSVFGGAPAGTAVISDNGTPSIPNDDVIVFTRTSTSTLPVYVYWTVSDGELEAQCQAMGGHLPPSDG
jgi:hypothetical protein